MGGGGVGGGNGGGMGGGGRARGSSKAKGASSRLTSNRKAAGRPRAPARSALRIGRVSYARLPVSVCPPWALPLRPGLRLAWPCCNS